MSNTAYAQRAPLNGVDVATLFATLDAVKGQNEIAKFQFRAENTWQTGTHSQSRIHGFYGAGQELTPEFRSPDAQRWYEQLKARNVITDVRAEVLRIGFGIYQDEADVDRLVEFLGEL